MKIYISGPEKYQGEYNDVERALQNEGHEVINRIKVLNQISLPERDKQEMTKCLVSMCDTIFLLTGWQQDPVSNLEFDKAVEERLCITFEDGKGAI